MIGVVLVGLGAVSLLGLAGRRRRRGSSSSSGGFGRSRTLTSGAVDSAREDDVDVLGEDGTTIDVDDATWDAIGDSLGWGYGWGGGSPSTPWAEPETGVDCGGWLQMALVRLGKLSGRAGDRGAIDLANASDPVPVGSQRPGDLAVYRGRHVMLVVSVPRAELGGHSHVMGASGGDSHTQGYNPAGPGYSPNARVKLFRSATYRRDFLTYARLR